MRFVAGLMMIFGLTMAAHAAPCRLTGPVTIEGRVGKAPLARTVDAKLGETIDVYVGVAGEMNGKRVVFGDGGAPRVSFADAAKICGPATVKWQRFEPLMEHTHTKAPNESATIYANAVVFGPKHGTWLGYDTLEYVKTDLPSVSTSLQVTDAAPSATIAMTPRRGERAKLGVMRLIATVELAGSSRGTPDARDRQVRDDMFRYTFRDGDGFLAWLSTFYNVPYLFGSAGKGARSQAERYIGADCADVLVAALRRSGHPNFEYSSVAELVEKLKKVSAPAELAACDANKNCGVTSLKWGSEVNAGDLIAIDYIGYDDLPRPWDHIVTLVEDAGPNGKPDGVLGGDDLTLDIGDNAGLKLQRLGDQGHIRVVVLRPPR